MKRDLYYVVLNACMTSRTSSCEDDAAPCWVKSELQDDRIVPLSDQQVAPHPTTCQPTSLPSGLYQLVG